jgi:hypothetical protein
MGVMRTRAMPDCQSGDFNVETHACLRDEVNQGNKRALTQLVPTWHMPYTDLATAPAYTPHPRPLSNTGLHITEYRDNLHRLRCPHRLAHQAGPYQKSYQPHYTHVRQHFENAIAGRNVLGSQQMAWIVPKHALLFSPTHRDPTGCMPCGCWPLQAAE